MNHDPRESEVAIHDVLAILSGIKQIGESTSFFDGGVSSSLRFDNFKVTVVVTYSGHVFIKPIRFQCLKAQKPFR